MRIDGVATEEPGSERDGDEGETDPGKEYTEVPAKLIFGVEDDLRGSGGSKDGARITHGSDCSTDIVEWHGDTVSVDPGLEIWRVRCDPDALVSHKKR